MIQTPVIKRLIIERISGLVIPPGTKDGLQAGIAFFSDPKKIQEITKQATEDIEKYINLIKMYDEYKNKSDDEIAQILLERIEAKKTP